MVIICQFINNRFKRSEIEIGTKNLEHLDEDFQAGSNQWRHLELKLSLVSMIGQRTYAFNWVFNIILRLVTSVVRSDHDLVLKNMPDNSQCDDNKMQQNRAAAE